jgi:hypothetical protein
MAEPRDPSKQNGSGRYPIGDPRGGAPVPGGSGVFHPAMMMHPQYYQQWMASAMPPPNYLHQLRQQANPAAMAAFQQQQQQQQQPVINEAMVPQQPRQKKSRTQQSEPRQGSSSSQSARSKQLKVFVENAEEEFDSGGDTSDAEWDHTDETLDFSMNEHITPSSSSLGKLILGLLSLTLLLQSFLRLI